MSIENDDLRSKNAKDDNECPGTTHTDDTELDDDGNPDSYDETKNIVMPEDEPETAKLSPHKMPNSISYTALIDPLNLILI